MLDWDDFRYVLALHRKGSLKEAARGLAVDQATMGRRIYALEERLGVELFEKRSDGFFLTTAGSRILATLEQAEAAFHSIDRKLAGQDERAEGKVRIAMPGALANHWLVPRLGPLLERNPGLELELLTGPEVINLSRREADLAVRLVRPSQRDLVIKKLGELELALYAPHALLSGKSARSAKDSRALAALAALEKVPFIGLYPEATSDAEAKLVERLGPLAERAAIRSAAWHSVFSALKAGLGFGILPTFMGDSEPSLRRLPQLESANMPIWLVVHPDVQKSARVRAVAAHLLQAFG